ncbi:MAG: sulfotransferase [Deltaproteobacteria bacterium]|nr:sulfotransferase [Deltaproteobacteria bacterium]
METPTSLDERSILDEARQKAGLADFGDESFREPLRVLLAALDTEAGLFDFGRAAQRGRTVDLLVNRLRAEDAFRRHPEILDEEIGAPIVIVGLPRTGTTFLHRTLAQDPRLYSARWFECRYPAPFPGGTFGAADPRIAQAKAEVQTMLDGSPALAAIHPLDAMAPDEEILLLEHAFLSTVPESAANVPSYGRWLDAHDQTPGYRYLRKLLQLLQWQKKRAGQRAERWVLKTPHHLGHADVLLDVFPGALLVQTHRDPLESIPSLASMITALWVLAAEHVDPQVVGRLWNARMAAALRRCLAVRDRHPGCFVDVWYLDAVRDPVAQARRIYDAAGLVLTAEVERAMRAFMATSPREGRPPHQYALEEFGLTPESIARDFGEYRARFILDRRS